MASRTATRPFVIHVPHDEIREPYLEIYSGRGKNRRLVRRAVNGTPTMSTRPARRQTEERWPPAASVFPAAAGREAALATPV